MISRGEGIFTVAIALSQADTLVEIGFVSLSSPLHGLLPVIPTNFKQSAIPQYPLLLALYFRFFGVVGPLFIDASTHHSKAPRERNVRKSRN